MKLNDLIEALAGEIELMKPHLDESLEQLATLGFEDNAFIDAMDQYSGQVQRMGEAAEMAGFPGLQALCTHVLELPIGPVAGLDAVVSGRWRAGLAGSPQ